jgi:hypothetical protein
MFSSIFWQGKSSRPPALLHLDADVLPESLHIRLVDSDDSFSADIFSFVALNLLRTSFNFFTKFAFFSAQFLHTIFVDTSLSISWPNSNSKFTQVVVFCNGNDE